MKKIILVCVGAVLLFSCGIEKRHYFPGYYMTGKNKKAATPIYFLDEKSQQENQAKIVPANEVAYTPPTNVSEAEQKELNMELATVLKENNEANLSKTEDCDIIVCKNGDEINAKVLEIGLSEIKYKKCDNQTGPTITILKSEVVMIKYPNGTKDVVKPNSSEDSASDEKTLNAFALVSMICGILALITYIGAILFGILGIVFGIQALTQYKKNPDKYKSNGKKMARAGIICGVVGLGILVLILILFML